MLYAKCPLLLAAVVVIVGGAVFPLHRPTMPNSIYFPRSSYYAQKSSVLSSALSTQSRGDFVFYDLRLGTNYYFSTTKYHRLTTSRRESASRRRYNNIIVKQNKVSENRPGGPVDPQGDIKCPESGVAHVSRMDRRVYSRTRLITAVSPSWATTSPELVYIYLY